jgi:hypothetical protein
MDSSKSSSVVEPNEILTPILQNSDDDMPTDPVAIQKLIDEEEAKQTATHKELEVVSLRQHLHNLRLQNASNSCVKFLRFARTIAHRRSQKEGQVVQCLMLTILGKGLYLYKHFH